MKRTRLALALLTALVCLCVLPVPQRSGKRHPENHHCPGSAPGKTSDEDEVDDLSYATSGGGVPLPETMDTTASSWCPRWTATPCM